MNSSKLGNRNEKNLAKKKKKKKKKKEREGLESTFLKHSRYATTVESLEEIGAVSSPEAEGVVADSISDRSNHALIP
jgi:hypothetical protein